MKRWIVIAVFAAACGGKKDEGTKETGGGTTTKPVEGGAPAELAGWMPKGATEAWAGAWSTRLTWGNKKSKTMSMAGNPVALEITGNKAKAFDGFEEATFDFAVDTPCTVSLQEKDGTTTKSYAQTFLMRDGALQVGSGAAGYRKGKTAIVCTDSSMDGVFVVDEKGCKSWRQSFDDKWESKDKKCTWSSDGGKDVLTLGEGDWARKVTADGDYLVSDQFTDTVKYTTKAASFDEAKQQVTAKVKEKDPGEIAKAAGGVVGKTDTIASLAASYAADKASLDGKPLEITALHFSTSTMTSNGEKSHIVSLVDSKEQTKITLSCRMKDEPPAGIKQYEKVTAKGTVKESFGTVGLEDCTLTKAK